MGRQLLRGVVQLVASRTGAPHVVDETALVGDSAVRPHLRDPTLRRLHYPLKPWAAGGGGPGSPLHDVAPDLPPGLLLALRRRL
eukprot:2913411-Pyramimonas_sp.AAC.1